MQMRKRQFYKMVFIVSVFVLFHMFIIIYQGAFVELLSATVKIPYSFWQLFIVDIGLAFVFGWIFATFEVIYFTRFFRKRSFGFALMTKTLFYIALFGYLSHLSFTPVCGFSSIDFP